MDTELLEAAGISPGRAQDISDIIRKRMADPAESVFQRTIAPTKKLASPTLRRLVYYLNLRASHDK
jgi:hypothetical protein